MLAARELLCVGLEKLGIPYIPSSANFVLGAFGERAIEVRDELRGQGILVRDRSYEAPGCVRITVGTRDQTRRLLARTGGDLVSMKPVLVFDMDGVLVDVTESYRETIAQTVQHFTGSQPVTRAHPGYKNQGGWNNDWKLVAPHHPDAGIDSPVRRLSKDYFQSIFLGPKRRSDPARAMDRRRGHARTLWPHVFDSPSSPGDRSPRPKLTLTASLPACVSIR